MIIHNINPELLSLGFVSIRYYGLVYFLGFLFAYFFVRYIAKKGIIPNFDVTKAESFILYLIIGSIVGARVLDFVFFNPQILFADPIEVFRVWNGGMSIHGGIIGALVAGYFYTKKYKVNFLKLADMAILPLLFILGVGRIANFINGELWGTKIMGSANSGLCVDYSQSQFISNPPSGCRYPYQLYASLKNFVVFGISLALSLKAKLKDGLLFFYSIIFYSVGRFFIDIMRDEPNVLIGLSMGQILCVVFFAVSVVYVIKIHTKKTVNSDSEDREHKSDKVKNKKKKVKKWKR